MYNKCEDKEKAIYKRDYRKMQALSGHMSHPRRRLGIRGRTEAVWESEEKQMTQSTTCDKRLIR
jgi:hypothetical protein